MAAGLRQDIIQFAKAIARHIGLVIGGVLFAVAAFVWNVIEWVLPNNAPRLPPFQWQLLWAWIVGFLFSAAFLAWRDELNRNRDLTEKVDEFLKRTPRVVPLKIGQCDYSRAPALWVQNDGEPASNLQFAPLQIGDVVVTMEPSTVHLTKDSGALCVSMNFKDPAQMYMTSDPSLGPLMKRLDLKSVEGTIHYQDVRGQRYRTVFRLDYSERANKGAQVSLVRLERAGEPI
jgi:hypothetical protein